MNSLKNRIAISMIIATILVAISSVLVFNIDLGEHYLAFATFIILVIASAYILGYVIAENITKQINRFQRNMRNVIDGKHTYIPNKKLPVMKEFQELSDTLSEMLSATKTSYIDLSSQKSKTEIILEHMTDGVVAFDLDKKVVHMNKSAMKLLLINENDDDYDKVARKLYLNVDFEKIMFMTNKSILQTKATIGENTMSLLFVPFYDNRYNPMGVIIVARNITETVKLDNMRREFVANVSHELKTPLTSIRGYAETILAGDIDEESNRKFVNVIYEEANRMNGLVADLLNLSKFDYKKVSWNQTKFCIDELAKHICEKMSIAAKEKNHKLECHITSKIPVISTDKSAVEQVIINVLSNSIKYTPDGGKIEVYVGSMYNNVYIKVKDNGIGIPKKDLQRIFERFYRVDKARSREMGGTGLGLSIVKEIVDNIGGNIEIKSEVGQGTEVIIYIPLKQGDVKK